MTVQLTTNIIQLIVAPVVMITSCSLILSGLLTRYAAVNDRLRVMTRERLDLVFAATPAGALQAERLNEIDRQTPDLLTRHTALHNSIFVVYGAILLFIANMFIIALAAFFDSAALATAVLIEFLLATLALFGGVLIAAIEVRSSHRAVQYETRRVSALPPQGKV